MSDMDRDRELVGRSGVIGSRTDDALPPHPNEIAAWLEATAEERENMSEITGFLAANTEFLPLLEAEIIEPAVPDSMVAKAKTLSGNASSTACKQYVWSRWFIPKPAFSFAAVALIASVVSGFSMGAAVSHAEKIVFTAVSSEMTFGSEKFGQVPRVQNLDRADPSLVCFSISRQHNTSDNCCLRHEMKLFT